MNRLVLLLIGSLLLPLGCGGNDAPTGPSFAMLVVTTTSLPNFVPNVAYSETLVATGGDGSYAWSVTVGSLPTGLNLNSSTGLISGTPTGSSSTFTIQVASGDGQTVMQALSISVNATPVTVINSPMANEVFSGIQTITWTTTDDEPPGTVDILLSENSGTTFSTVLATAAFDTGSFLWDTSPHPNDWNYRIRITPTDLSGVVGNSVESGDFIIGDLLYSVDFGSPPHTVGLIPVTSTGEAPRNYVSNINFGTPTVVTSLGALTDQPLEFDSFDLVGDQVQIQLNDLPSANKYFISVDISVVDVVTFDRSFVLFLDTPQVRSIAFQSDNSIREFVPGSSGSTIDSYTFGSKISLGIKVDLISDTWEIFINGNSTHLGGFGGATALQAIRFSTDVLSPPGEVSAAIDNLVIAGL